MKDIQRGAMNKGAVARVISFPKQTSLDGDDSRVNCVRVACMQQLDIRQAW